MKKEAYERPKVTTLTSSEILQMLGSASASVYGQETGIDLS